MKSFVIIFRQGPPTPTPEERQRITADVVGGQSASIPKAINSTRASLHPKGLYAACTGAHRFLRTNGRLPLFCFFRRTTLKKLHVSHCPTLRSGIAPWLRCASLEAACAARKTILEVTRVALTRVAMHDLITWEITMEVSC